VNIGRAVTVGVVGSLALATAAFAQAPPDTCTVTKEDVRTWTLEINGKDYEAHPATPTYEGTTGLFHLPSAYTLPKGKVSVSLFRDNLDRDPKDVDVSIHGVTIGYGATNALELFGNFGFQNRVNADALSQPGFVNDYPFITSPWQTGAGDIKLGLKYKFLDDYMGDALGLALRGFVKVGTADQNKGLGTGKSSVGVDLLLSKSLGRVADIHGGIGYQFNGDPSDPRPVAIGNAVTWGVGLNIPACRRFQIQAEVTGSSYTGAEFEQTNPVDLVVGPVIWLGRGFFIRPALSKNLNFDDRGLGSSAKSSIGRQISIGYHPGTACCAVAVPPAPTPAPPAANRAPTVACEAARATLAPGETVGLRAMASDPDNDSLSYSWSTTAGRISGTGASVTLETGGVAPPADIAATVRVSDGRGASAEASCPVRITGPERSRETITCESEGFPRNLARLNNVVKACLDDMASRLRQDPRSRVVVIGYADSAERRPVVVARQRAEAAKTYLVRERGIEESRVSVRSGATQPREAGNAQRNRRVELIFVPEGAVPPGEQ
jgi:outer membrane protein OmpA-like peptidoglycan-associated protein